MQRPVANRIAAALAAVFLFVCGHEATSAVPTNWTDEDIGAPAVAGGASFDPPSGTWTVSGSGADVWSTSDQFNFASQNFTGDGSIVARVTSVQNSSTYAKAGVMLRTSADANASYAFVFATPSSVSFECRNGTGASSLSLGSTGGAAPRWVKVTRSGNSFSGFVSSDGMNWTQIGSAQTIVMSGTVKAGLAVDANNNAALNTSTFTDVSVKIARPLRVNVAKLQNASADSAATGQAALFATDGIVGNGNAWHSSGAGPHWLTVTLPLAMQLGSAQLYFGTDDTWPIANFSLQYWNGSAWANIPGATFAGNAATLLNVVFTSPVTTSQVRLYTTDADVQVREMALYTPNGSSSGFPIGTDVTLNLAKKRLAAGTSANEPAKRAVDGYVGDYQGWLSDNDSLVDRLEIDLGTAARIGSAHLYSGSSVNPPISNFALESWNGSNWQAIPGATVSGNTQKERMIIFSSPVFTSRARLRIDVGYAQKVRELVIFPASTPAMIFPIGTDVVGSEPPTTKSDDLGDRFWSLINRGTGGILIADTTGASEAVPRTTEFEKQFQVIYNIDTDTFRIRNRASGKCLAAQYAGFAPGTAVVATDYHGAPWELWQIQQAENGFGYFVNMWNGLVLQTGGQSPASVTLQPLTGDWKQLWVLSFQSDYPKKGLGDYTWQWWRMGISWSYDWAQDPFGSLSAQVSFAPQQWSEAGVGNLPSHYPAWHTDAKPSTLLGYNEPDFTQDVGGSDMAVSAAIDLWPQLEAMDLPLVSPATAITYNGWMGDFYGQANARGYRVDYTGVHWYGSPNAAGVIAHLSGIYNTWGRPVYLTEFATVDWTKQATWSEEDNYRFFAEFLWMAEDQPWLKRYACFGFYEDPPVSPWDRVAPKSALFKVDGNFNAAGDVYAGWDGDRTIRNDTAYILHSKGSSFHLGNNGGITLQNIRANGTDMQWALVPTTANPYVVYLVSLRDGRRLHSDGNGFDLAAPSTSGSAVEWTYTHLANGYFVLNHLGSGKRLRLNRTNDGNGAPTGLWLSMDSPAATDDFVQWRFIKPAQPAAIASLPGGWNAQDIGSPQQHGSAFFDTTTGLWIVEGGGADILGQVDQFQYVSQDFAGDGTIIARVGTVQNTDQYAKAGVMFRDSPTSDSLYAYVFVGPGTIGFEYRNAAGGTSQSAAYVGGTAPAWVKLVRNANNFSGYYSSDGVNWTQLGTTQSIAMSTTATTGLAVTAHNNSVLNSSTFSNVSVIAAPPTPNGLTATPGNAQVTLSWSAAPSATSYNVKRATTAGGPYTTITTQPGTSYSDNGLSNGTTYYYIVSAVNGGGESATSSLVNATPFYLPSVWNDQDIGAPGVTGVATLDTSTGTWTIIGSGTDIFGAADQFNFVAEDFTGNGTIVARVTGVQNTDQYAKAVIMFRDTANANAMFAHVFVGPSSVGFECRTATGGSAFGVAYASGNAPLWVKLLRSGNNFTGFYSADGANWIPLGATQTIPMSGTAKIGLAVTSHNNSLLCAATFDNVQIAAAPPPPTVLTAAAGNAQVALKWNASSGAASYNVKRTTITGGPYTIIASAITTGYTDTGVVNGATYFYVVSAMNAGGESDNSIQASATPTSVPVPWQTADIGSVGATGSSGYNSGTFTVTGSGADIAATADAFRYVYQAASGDCTIVARVTSVQNTDASAKAGVMIRESLAANSKHATVVVTPGSGVAFLNRASLGGTTSSTTKTGLAAPYWVKVVRSGNTFTAYRSANGSSWTKIASKSITMAANVSIGLVVTSHHNGTLCTATFDNVTATP